MTQAVLMLRRGTVRLACGGVGVGVGVDAISQMASRVDDPLALSPGRRISFGCTGSINDGASAAWLAEELMSIFA